MRLSEFCTSQDIDRAIAVTVDSFVGSQKVSCKKALARAFAKYVTPPPAPPPFTDAGEPADKSDQVHFEATGSSPEESRRTSSERQRCRCCGGLRNSKAASQPVIR
jgi:hypothetical protein